MPPRLEVRSCGAISYADGLSLQEQARRQVADGEWDGVLLLLEHLPVITVGRSGGRYLVPWAFVCTGIVLAGSQLQAHKGCEPLICTGILGGIVGGGIDAFWLIRQRSFAARHVAFRPLIG